jgi:uncharacterized protein (DUF2235 family)
MPQPVIAAVQAIATAAGCQLVASCDLAVASRTAPRSIIAQAGLKQVWFPGVHCDVGGGYPEAESGLSKIALEWMLTEAIAAGLIVDPAKVDLVLGKSGGGYVPADPNAIMHESLTAMWWLAEYLPKRHFNWDRHEWRR